MVRPLGVITWNDKSGISPVVRCKLVVEQYEDARSGRCAHSIHVPWSTVMDFGELRPVGDGETIKLTKDRLLIGRHRLCDIVFHTSHIAPVQCQLVLENGVWTIRNLSDGAMTKVNGCDVTERKLTPGDSIWLGSKTRYRLHMASSAQSRITRR